MEPDSGLLQGHETSSVNLLHRPIKEIASALYFYEDKMFAIQCSEIISLSITNLCTVFSKAGLAWDKYFLGTFSNL